MDKNHTDFLTNKNRIIHISYLGEMLNLTLDPKSKESKKSNCKENKENRLNTENTTNFCNLNGTIVKCALVWMLIYFIDNCANKIKWSRLQQQEYVSKAIHATRVALDKHRE